MRYIPHTEEDRREMLRTIGVKDIDDLFIDIPKKLRLSEPLDIPESLDEHKILKSLHEIGSKNLNLLQVTSFLGAGVYEHYIPSIVMALISRGEFLTSYTPYQAEASQGYLQTIYEFQSLICEITGMDVTNASMYDGGTAAAEAVLMASQIKNKSIILMERSLHPHYRQCIETFARTSGSEVETFDLREWKHADNKNAACLVVQYPDFFGRITDLSNARQLANECNALLIVVAEPIALGLLEPPGNFGADIVVGELQPCGIPMGYGGPMAGYFCVRKEWIRSMPGRIVGKTHDKEGRRGFVMTLRTREQDIRREKATSNICTNQALMALAATIWLSALGKHGFRKIAETCVQKAHYLAKELCKIPGVELQFPEIPFAFEFCLNIGRDGRIVRDKLLQKGYLAGLPLGDYYPDMQNCILIAVTEVRTKKEMDDFVSHFAEVLR
ncbi:MAG TPA: aminomethyl-transferring glycine dehydrogenase subunit GcvPA [Fimbriimonadales bacterium]|nr:aminomethyl-transferring glycine dehydrogenase subunit GcvPA [Fimbriimonadales bacterium]